MVVRTCVRPGSTSGMASAWRRARGLAFSLAVPLWALGPLPARAPFAGCEQQPNPNPQTWTMRALYVALVDWIRLGKEPPPGARPTLAAGNLWAAPQSVRAGADRHLHGLEQLP
jgi:hypothetical protein